MQFEDEKIIDSSLKGLSKEQREAVLSEHKRLLVLAGAGSGKTRTIIQKIIFLISEKNISPSNIFAVTFTKNAANEMVDRMILSADKENSYKKIIENKALSQTLKEETRRKYVQKYPWLSNLTTCTFHSFCYHLLRKHGAKEFDNQFRIVDDKTYDEDIENKHKSHENQKQILQKIVKQACEDSEYFLRLKRYILEYYVDEYRRRMNERGYKEYAKPYTTLKGEQVRSKSERYIADWLYIHNINYIYEPEIEIKDFQFKPDFYVPSADLYLEHVSNLSSNMPKKESQFKLANKLLIKTYETMVKDIREFYHSLDRIIAPRINEKIKKEIVINFESEFRTYFKQFDIFISMVLEVMNKMKVEDVNPREIYEKAAKDPHDRIKIFYELTKPLIEEYTHYCIKKSYIDFNDLIILAIDLFERDEPIRRAFQEKFKFILIDEFQDVNTLQVRLVKCLLSETNQLFCVGDDWQSIYGWRGSELDYVINFKKYFQEPKIIKLSINYRSNETIVRASNELIKRNKYRIDKDISAISKSGRKIYLYCAKKEKEDGVELVFDRISQFLKQGYAKEDILVLYRRSVSIEPYKEKLKGLAKLRTIHSAKGLEAKIVFVVGLTGGINGFPQVWESDRILQIIKPSNYELILEEERRLFYVAITRAKEELFLISEVGNESDFIKEIPREYIDRSNFFILPTKCDTIKYCKKCNKRIENGFAYCPYCGEITENSQK